MGGALNTIFVESISIVMNTICHCIPKQEYRNKWHKIQAQGHLNALCQQILQKSLFVENPNVDLPRVYRHKDYKNIPLRNLIKMSNFNLLLRSFVNHDSTVQRVCHFPENLYQK